MISRFFEGTKPINYLVLLIFLLVFILLKFFFETFGVTNAKIWGSLAIGFVFLALQIYVANEIATKANIAEQSSFPMLFFVLLILAFSEVLSNTDIIVCNLFVILAIFNVLTIDGTKKINLNFFIAALWILVASIFYPFAIFYLVPLLLAILFYGASEIRNWLMPIAAIIGFTLVILAASIIMGESDFLMEHYRLTLPEGLFAEFNFDGYTRLSFYAMANSILLLILFSRLKDIGKGRVLELRMLFLFFVLGIIITLLSLGPEVGLQSILLTFCPVSIFITNYFQIFRKKRLREYILLFVIVAPISISIWKLFG